MVEINPVYETVLAILNKEQRGYLDPTEFNLLAKQVQREIFEGYFLKAMAAPDMGPTQASPELFLDQKTNIFEEVTEINETDENLSKFNYPTDLYRLGLVTYNGIVADYVGHKEAAYITRAPLTAPTPKQPIAVIHKDHIKMYPDSPDDVAVEKIQLIYLRTPSDPNWTYMIDDDNEIIYNGDDTAKVDFELHPSEFHELVVRICGYAGVVVRAQEVMQFAAQQEGKITQTEQ